MRMLEIMANLACVTGTLLVLRGDPRGPWFSLTGTVPFLVLFLERGLYATALLQVIYAGINLHAMVRYRAPGLGKR